MSLAIIVFFFNLVQTWFSFNPVLFRSAKDLSLYFFLFFLLLCTSLINDQKQDYSPTYFPVVCWLSVQPHIRGTEYRHRKRLWVSRISSCHKESTSLPSSGVNGCFRLKKTVHNIIRKDFWGVVPKAFFHSTRHRGRWISVSVRQPGLKWVLSMAARST